MLCAVGLLLCSGLGHGWIGRLPGAIYYTKGNFQFSLSHRDLPDPQPRADGPGVAVAEIKREALTTDYTNGHG